MALLTCKNLSVGYDGVAVASGISFSLFSGDYLAVIGENGAGKTTVMKTVLGLIKQISGEIETGDGLKRNEIGYLPQQTAVQRDFPASVWEVVLSGRLSKIGLRPFYDKEEKRLAEDMLEELNIAHLKKRPYHELSGGQQQRVLLARALLATRKVLLLDEPVAGLDPIVTTEMYETIENLNKKGTSVIMITHDIAAAKKYANKILYIGANVFFGSKEEFIKSSDGKIFGSAGRNKK
ncbi:MAG: metal ABC transporter ATP-binding protein [Clostridia bacterium]|nr:metal ABC transporter ATP-binding protein [Clostridia bacterium]